MKLDFDSVYQYVTQNKIEGWCLRNEAKRLYRLVGEISKALDIVELGAFHGLSTIYLAAASQRSGRTRQVISVDHFRGSKDSLAVHEDLSPKGIRTHFFENLIAVNLLNMVRVFEMSTLEAAHHYKGPGVGLLFIDASHEWEGCSQDFLAWYPKVVVGGHIVFHDATTWVDPKRLYKKTLEKGYVTPDLTMGYDSATVDTSAFGVSLGKSTDPEDF